jgi:hypothetical protein
MNIEDIFNRYGIYFSERSSLDEKLNSFEKLLFFMEEEDSLVKKNINKLNWNKQIKKGVEGAHHPSPINK